MDKKFIKNYIDIANIHATKLDRALKELEGVIPLTSLDFKELPSNVESSLDKMALRFAKLQDIIGGNIFPVLINIIEPYRTETYSFHDKINFLEKIGYLDSAQWWTSLRILQNQLAHEYPDDELLLIQTTHLLFKKSDELLSYWKNLQDKINTLLYTNSQ
jgi:hypothetical protein